MENDNSGLPKQKQSLMSRLFRRNTMPDKASPTSASALAHVLDGTDVVPMGNGADNATTHGKSEELKLASAITDTTSNEGLSPIYNGEEISSNQTTSDPEDDATVTNSVKAAKKVLGYEKEGHDNNKPSDVNNDGVIGQHEGQTLPQTPGTSELLPKGAMQSAEHANEHAVEHANDQSAVGQGGAAADSGSVAFVPGSPSQSGVDHTKDDKLKHVNNGHNGEHKLKPDLDGWTTNGTQPQDNSGGLIIPAQEATNKIDSKTTNPLS